MQPPIFRGALVDLTVDTGSFRSQRHLGAPEQSRLIKPAGQACAFFRRVLMPFKSFAPAGGGGRQQLTEPTTISSGDWNLMMAASLLKLIDAMR